LRKQLEIILGLYKSSLNGEIAEMIQKINSEVINRKKLPRGIIEWEGTCQISGVFWGRISYYGVETITHVDGKINKDRYISVFK